METVYFEKNTDRLSLSLPKSGDGERYLYMDIFYKALSEKIEACLERAPKTLKRCSVKSVCSENGKYITVNVKICIRLRINGSYENRERSLTQVWKNGRLVKSII